MATTTENKIFEQLSEELKDTGVQILAPGVDGYEESIKRWSEAAEKRASAVVFPSNTEEVSTVVKALRKHDIEFVVCCGRHSTGGASSIAQGVVIDMKIMNKVTVSEDNKTLLVEGGATWRDVDVEAAKFGLATVGGTVNHTGVGGLILGGGWGWLAARHGLTIDNLLSCTLVLSSGTILTASPTQNPDLFWALRGAGSSFAVVTSFTLQAHAQPNPVWAGILIFTPDKLDDIVKVANWHHENAKEEGLIFGFVCAPPDNVPMVMAVVFYNGTEEDGRAFFKPLLDVGPVMDMTSTMPYSEVNAMFNNSATFGDRKTSGASAITYPFQPANFQELWKGYTEFAETNKEKGVEGSIVLFSLIPYKKILGVPLDSMAFGSRGEYYNAEILFRWRDPAFDLEARKLGREFNERIRALGGVLGGAGGVGNYANNMETQVDPKRIWGKNTERLVELKKKYDPENCFSKWHDVLFKESNDWTG